MASRLSELCVKLYPRCMVCKVCYASARVICLNSTLCTPSAIWAVACTDFQLMAYISTSVTYANNAQNRFLQLKGLASKWSSWDAGVLQLTSVSAGNFHHFYFQICIRISSYSRPSLEANTALVMTKWNAIVMVRLLFETSILFEGWGCRTPAVLLLAVQWEGTWFWDY